MEGRRAPADSRYDEARVLRAAERGFDRAFRPPGAAVRSPAILAAGRRDRARCAASRRRRT